MLPALLDRCRRQFVGRYGTQPEVFVAAPGRVNLIGEHTDYNEGFVLPMAIERYVVIGACARGRGPERFQITSAELGETADIQYQPRPRPGPPVWANYPRGVVAGFLDRGVTLPSVDAVMVSSVPLGGGLSSSAALEVATATLLEVVGDVRLDPLDKARLCQKAEHDYAGVPCGIMDQMISVLADPNGALLIDCRSESTQIVPMADSTFGFLIANTNVRHSLASGEYALRRNQCREAARKLGLTSLRDATLTLLDTHFGELSGAEGRRARHVITENERTLRAADALRRADLTTLGVLMSDSHRSLRHDFEVSCPELDVLVDAALAMGQGEGVFGARMTGGGFGGCTLTLIRNECASAVYARLDSEYRRIVGRPLDGFVSRPARGAHRLAPTSIAD